MRYALSLAISIGHKYVSSVQLKLPYKEIGIICNNSRYRWRSIDVEVNDSGND